MDTETTGLVENMTKRQDLQPEIIELTALRIDLTNGKIVSEIDTLIKPKGEISEFITGITHITNEMVKDAKTFAMKANDIFAFIEEAPLIIAHNARFDHDMLDLEASRLHRKIKWPRVLCTIEATIYIKGRRMGLSELHEYLFGTRFESAHRARPDTDALAKCCVELYKRGAI